MPGVPPARRLLPGLLPLLHQQSGAAGQGQAGGHRGRPGGPPRSALARRLGHRVAAPPLVLTGFRALPPPPQAAQAADRITVPLVPINRNLLVRINHKHIMFERAL